MEIRWYLKAFNALSLEELYQILRLRNEVFIVEQNCPYQDMDNADQKALHLLGLTDEGWLLIRGYLSQGSSLTWLP